MKLIPMLSLLAFPVIAYAADGGARAREPFDAAMAAKASAYVRECNGPGAQPKPKMGEFVEYLWANGLKDAKVECGVSNFGKNAPMIMIHAADGGEYYVNFVPGKGKASWRTGEVILDSNTPEGKKRKVVWPRTSVPSQR